MFEEVKCNLENGETAMYRYGFKMGYDGYQANPVLSFYKDYYDGYMSGFRQGILDREKEGEIQHRVVRN